MTGTLVTPAATASLPDQVQSLLAQTYAGSGSPSASQWWVTACEEGTRNAWDASLLGGLAYDPSVAASPAPQPRRMWVRAEARVDGHKRAVVGLVQAGQQPVFPSNLAVVTGTIGADLRTTANQALTGNVVGPLLTSLLGGSGKPFDGSIGLRCSLLDQTELLGCLNGLYKATSMTTVAPLLQGNNYVDFRSDSTISSEQLALLRQQAKASGTYYANTSTAVGGVAANASCLPAGSAGKVVFIEQVGDGDDSCLLNTSGGAQAAALIVGSGGVRVVRSAHPAAASNACPSPVTTTTGDGTFRGVIYALHRKVPSGGAADVRIECGSKVFGGVFVDDNDDLGASAHGQVEVISPQINMSTVITSITSTLPLCGVWIVGPIACSLATLLTKTLDQIISTLGISPATLAAAILPQLNTAFPAVTYNAANVQAVSTFGDSAVVTGTFRQVTPMF